jgi:GDPmannose 4,6-dehydratase
LQKDEPEDFVIATGETRSVRDFVEASFNFVGLDWKNHVEFDSGYLRPTEVDLLIGDASKAKAKLGWEAKVRFDELVRIMMDADLLKAEREAAMPKETHIP